MTKDTALRLALEALKNSWTEPNNEQYEIEKEAIVAIKAALEAKDEKANDELRRLHDLLGKANALARIRANKIDELEQRLTKTEAQLGEAVWNYGELKREQLANQQKTSGSPINTSTALEAKDEPVGFMSAGQVLEMQQGRAPYGYVYPKLGSGASVALYTTPPQRTWVGLTDEDFQPAVKKAMVYYGYKPEHSTLTSGAGFYELVRAIEAKLKEKNT